MNLLKTNRGLIYIKQIHEELFCFLNWEKQMTPSCFTTSEDCTLSTKILDINFFGEAF